MNPDQTTPANDPPANDRNSAAVELIRSKVARAYAEEPDASKELAEVKAERMLSKHQLYMQQLSSSGQSLAEIQTAWHYYYTTLPDTEKHEVWQEFYAANQHTPYQKLFQKQHQVASRSILPEVKQPEETETTSLPIPTTPKATATEPASAKQPKVTIAPHEPTVAETGAPTDNRTTSKIKQQIVNRINANGNLKLKHHFQSLGFGLATGAVVLLILMFSFFNDRVIAPFIQPSRTVSATPIILGDGSNLDTSTPQVIIPKINVQIPLNFSIQTNDENAIENALEGGVVHYPSTVNPGQNGNAAFFGHSSNNIFNPGKYKFAFVLLHTLTTGDIFYITYNNTEYAYRVFDRQVVPPSQVSVLNDTRGKTATAALITCDPPGTSNNRLVVWGEQISPAITTNTATALPAAATAVPTQLANNGPSLWSRFVNTLEFWN